MQDRSRCCAGRTIAVGSGNTQPVSSSSVHARPRSYTCLAQQSSPPDCDQQSTPPQRSHVSGQQTLASTALFEGSSAKCTCPIFPIEHSSATAATASVRRVTIQDRAGMGWVACDHGPGLSAATSAPPRSASASGGKLRTESAVVSQYSTIALHVSVKIFVSLDAFHHLLKLCEKNGLHAGEETLLSVEPHRAHRPRLRAWI